MKSFILAMTLFVAPFAFANESASEPFKLIQAETLATWLKDGSGKVHVYDANVESVRKKDGIIPGAALLTSSSGFDAAKVLPTDKNAKVVFYCANTMCTASHDAAKVAAKAGYKEVYVMSDGIQGWKKAGKSSVPFNKKS